MATQHVRIVGPSDSNYRLTWAGRFGSSSSRDPAETIDKDGFLDQEPDLE